MLSGISYIASYGYTQICADFLSPHNALWLGGNEKDLFGSIMEMRRRFSVKKSCKNVPVLYQSYHFRFNEGSVEGAFSEELSSKVRSYRFVIMRLRPPCFYKLAVKLAVKKI